MDSFFYLASNAFKSLFKWIYVDDKLEKNPRIAAEPFLVVFVQITPETKDREIFKDQNESLRYTVIIHMA